MTIETTKVHHYEDETPGAWGEFITAMHSGHRFECDEAMFDYWLEVLPPAWMGRTVTLDGVPIRTSFGFCEGYDFVTAFWKQGGRFFGQRTAIMNPRGY
jgi:hypothetical protein